MVKQKHHTARNQTYKWHRNGIKKAPRTKFIKLMGLEPKYVMNMRMAKKHNVKAHREKKQKKVD